MMQWYDLRSDKLCTNLELVKSYKLLGKTMDTLFLGKTKYDIVVLPWMEW